MKRENTASTRTGSLVAPDERRRLVVRDERIVLGGKRHGLLAT
jgi:hypothetical protein